MLNINIRFREVNDPDYCYMLHEIIEHESDCGRMILSIILDLDYWTFRNQYTLIYV